MLISRSKRNKRFPHLVNYVKNVTEVRIAKLRRISNAIGAVIVGFTAPIVGVAIGLTTDVRYGLLCALVAMPISVFAWYMIDKRIRKPKTEEEAKRMESWKASNTMWKLEQQRKLHKQLDPSMSQLLEAAAFHNSRLMLAVAGKYWTSDQLPAHWRSVREQALAAAEQAMEELIMLGSTCMGEPETNRGQAFKEAAENFADLDIAVAIGELKDAAAADWTKFSHHSPNTKHAFEPARHIADRLKKLADEIEAKSEEVIKESGEHIKIDSAASSIDVVLSEMNKVSEAEVELQQRTKN